MLPVEAVWAWMVLHWGTLLSGLSGGVIVIVMLETFIYSRHEQQSCLSWPLPSAVVAQCAHWVQKVLTSCGYWLARLLNPLYYLRKLLPWLEPVWNAVVRLVKATGWLDHPPFYHFFSGFFASMEQPLRGLSCLTYGDLTALLSAAVYLGWALQQGWLSEFKWSLLWYLVPVLLLTTYMLFIKTIMWFRGSPLATPQQKKPVARIATLKKRSKQEHSNRERALRVRRRLNVEEEEPSSDEDH